MANMHKHSPWRKSILIPFWVLQIILSAIMVVSFGAALGFLASDITKDTTVEVNGEIVSYVSSRPAAEGIAGVWLGLNCVCLILIIVEIVLLARHKLNPRTFVIMNTLKTAFWVVIFVFGIVGAVQRSSEYKYGTAASAISLVFEACLVLCFLIPLIYGSIIFHRFRKSGGAYAAVLPTRTLAAGELGESAYPSQYTPFVRDHDVEMGQRVPGARRLSYNHTKDTRFESYRQPSASPNHMSRYGEPGPLETTVMTSRDDVPNIHIEHHGETYELQSSRGALT